MKMHHNPRIKEVVSIDTPYGGDVHPGPEMEVFKYLGIVEDSGSPTVAYSLMDTQALMIATGLVAFHGATPYDSISWLWACEVAEVPPSTQLALGEAVTPFLIPGDYDTEVDAVEVVRNKYTGEVLFYHYYIKQDGTSAIFTVEFE